MPRVRRTRPPGHRPKPQAERQIMLKCLLLWPTTLSMAPIDAYCVLDISKSRHLDISTSRDGAYLAQLELQLAISSVRSEQAHLSFLARSFGRYAMVYPRSVAVCISRTDLNSGPRIHQSLPTGPCFQADRAIFLRACRVMLHGSTSPVHAKPGTVLR